MPRYDYRCDRGHVSEAVRGYEDNLIPCPVCGGEASRAQVYRDQYIDGETVAGMTGGNEAIDSRTGRYRMAAFVEAHAEAVTAREREGQEAPSYFLAGVKRAQAMKAAGVPCSRISQEN